MNKSFPKIGVLVSGQGSNLQSIIDHIQSGKLEADISLVASDQADAFALERASKSKIPCVVVDRKIHASKDDFDLALIAELQNHEVEWVVLAGFMRILGKSFLTKYPRKIINIHPSLLPKYPGLQAIQKALKNKEKETGVTVHYVDEGVDTGPIILQEKIAIRPNETVASLEARIHELEHQIYPKALQKVLWNK